MEKERERNIEQLPLPHAPTGDQACSPGMCLDQKLNQRPFALQGNAQPSLTSQDTTTFLMPLSNLFLSLKWNVFFFFQ